jgi:hypothetical protein
VHLLGSCDGALEGNGVDVKQKGRGIVRGLKYARGTCMASGGEEL